MTGARRAMASVSRSTRSACATLLSAVTITGVTAILAFWTCAGGCTALEEWGHDEPSRTGGVTMSLQISRPDQQAYELFRVTRLGALEYGGGLKAFNESTGWSGTMTAEEIEQFLAQLDASGWCAEEPASDPASTVRCRIELRCTEARHTWTIKGEPDSVKSMRALLEPIARRRFAPELDRLPEATEKPPAAPPAPASSAAAPSAPSSP